jgi:hypothetical protein
MGGRMNFERTIGLYGSKGVGKNFVADRIVECVKRMNSCFPSMATSCHAHSKVFALADPIKRFGIDMLGISEEKAYGNDADKMGVTEFEWESMPFEHSKSGPMTIREVLQVVGTELGRNIWDKEIWIKALKRRVGKFYDRFNGGYAVVCDVRFDNEVQAIHDMGGEVWVVEGPQRINESSGGDQHASEVQRTDVSRDATINNREGVTKEEVFDQVMELIKKDWKDAKGLSCSPSIAYRRNNGSLQQVSTD